MSQWRSAKCPFEKALNGLGIGLTVYGGERAFVLSFVGRVVALQGANRSRERLQVARLSCGRMGQETGSTGRLDVPPSSPLGRCVTAAPVAFWGDVRLPYVMQTMQSRKRKHRSRKLEFSRPKVVWATRSSLRVNALVQEGGG